MSTVFHSREEESLTSRELGILSLRNQDPILKKEGRRHPKKRFHGQLPQESLGIGA